MATPEFLAKWRSQSGRLALLAKVTLPRADGTQTDALYLSMADQHSAANSDTAEPSRLWLGAVKSFGPIGLRGGFGSTDLSLVNASMVLRADHQVTFPADISAAITGTLRQSVSTHVWLNATVTIWRYFHELGDFKHAQQVFKGGVLLPEIEGDDLKLSLRQMVPWNKPLTPRTVNKQEFPRVPDSTVGLSLPIVYGDMGFQPMRRPWAKRPTGFPYFAAVASKQGRYAKAILSDPGRGGQATQNLNPKVHVAGHAVTSVLDEANGRLEWMDTEAGLALLLGPTLNSPYGGGGGTTAQITAFSGATGSGFTIPDTLRYAILPMIPAEIVTFTNQADNARNLLDPNDATYAYFDYAGLKRVANFTFQSPKNIGDGTIRMDTIVGYQSDAGLTDFNFYLDPTGGGTYTTYGNIPASTTPAISRTLFFGAGSAWPTPATWIAKLGFGASGAGTIRVFFVGLIIYFRPVQEVVQSERLVTTQEIAIQDRDAAAAGLPYRVPVRTPAVTEVFGNFVSCPAGIADSGGTYTGSGTSLIERAPDIMTHLLNVYGGAALNDIERGATSFGSFVYARSLLSVNGTDPVHAFGVTESTDVLTALLWLTADSFTKLIVSPYDSKLRLIVWRTDPDLDYPTLLSAEDVNEPLGPDVKLTPIPDIVTDIRVSYGYDTRERAYRSETSLAPDRSTAGYEFRGLRDQNLTVIPNVSDRMDFRANTTAGGGFTTRLMVLTPASYVPQSTKSPTDFSSHPYDYEGGLAQQVKAQFQQAETGGGGPGRYQVTWGTQITTGYNDQLSIIRNAVTYDVILPANDGTQTCEQLAAAVQTAVNAATSGVQTNQFFCYYDRATNRFAVYNSEVVVWKIKGTQAAGDYTSTWMQRSAWATLGFYQGGTDATINLGLPGLFADDVRQEEHFGIMTLGGTGATPAPKFELELLFQSGTNGTDSATAVRHCGELLGFDASEDKLKVFSPAGGHSYVADGPKGVREAQMQISSALYGRRREVALNARTIQKGVGPRSLRNRIADFFRAPRPVISFTTRAMPDVEEGQVFGFREEMPRPYPCPGSNGLWVGKKFVVVEYDHEAGPTSLDTAIVAVDAGLLAGVVVAIGIGIVVGGAFIERLA